MTFTGDNTARLNLIANAVHFSLRSLLSFNALSHNIAITEKSCLLVKKMVFMSVLMITSGPHTLFHVDIMPQNMVRARVSINQTRQSIYAAPCLLKH